MPDEGEQQVPIEEELWTMAREAVRDAAAQADAYVATGRWTPRYALPSVRAFDSGWPNLSRTTLGDDGPVRYSALFGPERGPLKPLAYGDVPALAQFIQYVRGRADLQPRLIPEHLQGLERGEDLFVIEAANLPLSLLNRSRALGSEGEDSLLRLYVQRERAWLMDPLPVEYVVPLALARMELDEPLALDASTQVEPIEPRLQAARAPDDTDSVNSVPTPVLGAATHAIVLRGHHIENPGPIPRLFAGTHGSLPLSDTDRVCEALRVLTDVPLGYAQVLCRPLGWADSWTYDLPPVTQVAALRRYPDEFDNYGWLRTGEPIARSVLDRLPKLFVSIRTAPPKIRLAVRRLSLASLRGDDDDRTVDACIGLEALLSNDRDELSHRISLRAAAALATRAGRRMDAKAVYSVMRSVYNHRSAVVHGTTSDKHEIVKIGDHRVPASEAACVLLRALLSEALERPGGLSPAGLDEILLDRLDSSSEPEAIAE